MSNTLQFIIGMSCLIPAVLAAIKFRRTDQSYHPFFILMFVAVATELMADLPILLYNNYYFLSLIHPIYYILEILLMLLFYRRNDIITRYLWVWLVPLSGIGIYALNYYYNHVFETGFGKYCIIGFTIINLILAIKLLSNEIFETKTKAFKNPKMVIAFGCILYYAFYLMVKVLLSFNTQVNIWVGIFSIHQVINALSYLIFTWAIIWVPTKRI